MQAQICPKFSIKSAILIQKIPSSAFSNFSCCLSYSLQTSEKSDHLPFHSYFPQGFCIFNILSLVLPFFVAIWLRQPLISRREKENFIFFAVRLRQPLIPRERVNCRKTILPSQDSNRNFTVPVRAHYL